jgi:hypothetical protein
MPDHEGRTKGPGTKTPDQAYKEGRAEDVQQGSLGADIDRMDDAPDQQNAAPGAAVDSQGYGQHGDQDVTDTSTKQQHPRTPSDMGR